MFTNIPSKERLSRESELELKPLEIAIDELTDSKNYGRPLILDDLFKFWLIPMIPIGLQSIERLLAT